mgnify:CR=1 FL=1
MRSLEEKIKSLPIDLRKEVEDFIDFLIERKMKKGVKKPMFTWEGALKELKDQYNSVELQEVKAFLTSSEDGSLYISDYSLHSIGNLLFRRNKC